ncbi:OmpH family outer membrane protein [bacterium]|nr:MAG: OmpH family outer membrane protein [bacterium]
MSTRIYQFGSALSLLLLGVLVAGGFQAAADKNGVADINWLVDNSNFGKGARETLNRMRTSREEVLSFIDTNRVLTVDQATKLRDLTLKEGKTPAEQAELDTLKATIVATNKKWTELATKGTLTPEERTTLQDYSERAQRMTDLGKQWVNTFTNEIESFLDKQKAEGSARAREAINSTAKAQGYTMIYDKVFAPYGANDLTEAALAAMNAKP